VIEGSLSDEQLLARVTRSVQLYGRVSSAPDRCVLVGDVLVSVYWPYRITPYTLTSQADGLPAVLIPPGVPQLSPAQERRMLNAVSRAIPQLPGMAETIPFRQRFLLNEWYRYAAVQAAERHVPSTGTWSFNVWLPKQITIGPPKVCFGLGDERSFATPRLCDCISIQDVLGTGRLAVYWDSERHVMRGRACTHDEGVTWTLWMGDGHVIHELGKVRFDWYGGFIQGAYRYYSLDYSRGWNTLREAMDDLEGAHRPA
jgi:hypothetical protein